MTVYYQGVETQLYTLVETGTLARVVAHVLGTDRRSLTGKSHEICVPGLAVTS